MLSLHELFEFVSSNQGKFPRYELLCSEDVLSELKKVEAVAEDSVAPIDSVHVLSSIKVTVRRAQGWQLRRDDKPILEYIPILEQGGGFIVDYTKMPKIPGYVTELDT